MYQIFLSLLLVLLIAAGCNLVNNKANRSQESQSPSESIAPQSGQDGSIGQAVDWETYENKKHELSIKYPSHFKPLSETADSIVLSRPDMKGTAITVTVKDSQGDDLYTYFAKDAQNNLKLEFTYQRLANQDGILYVNPIKIGDMDQTIRAFMFKKDGLIYQIGIRCPNSNLDCASLEALLQTLSLPQ